MIPDFRGINALTGIIALVIVALYWRSGKHREYLAASIVFFLVVGYYTGLYAAALIFSVDNATISAWARPAFSPLVAAAAIVFLVAAYNDSIAEYTQRRGKNHVEH